MTNNTDPEHLTELVQKIKEIWIETTIEERITEELKEETDIETKLYADITSKINADLKMTAGSAIVRKIFKKKQKE